MTSIHCSGWQACHSAELQERGESCHAHIYGASIWKDGVLVEQACSRATDKHDSNLRTGWVSMPTDPATMPRGEVPVGYACPHIRQACQVVECWWGKHAHRLGKHAR